jgi:mannitol/fructose-specific phosphotransferase system IIA component (Ntr-type)
MKMQNFNIVLMKRMFTEFLILDLEGKNKSELMLNIAEFAQEKGLVMDAAVLYQQFLARERQRGIGVVPGLAFPEASGIEMSRPFACILCRTRQTVVFERMDMSVRIVLVSLFSVRPDATCMRAMAKLVGLVRSPRFCEDFLECGNEEEVYRAMARSQEKQ